MPPRLVLRFVLILVISAAYAVLRYCVFGPVSVTNIPVYVANKFVSASAVVALCFAAVSLKQHHAEESRWWGKACIHLAFVHVALSFCILTPAYFPGFFSGATSRMNVKGEMLVLLGAAAAYLFWLLMRNGSDQNPRLRNRLIVAAGCLICAHLLFVGWPGWIKPGDWHGYLPPISLLTFLITAAATGLYAGQIAGRKEP